MAVKKSEFPAHKVKDLCAPKMLKSIVFLLTQLCIMLANKLIHQRTFKTKNPFQLWNMDLPLEIPNDVGLWLIPRKV